MQPDRESNMKPRLPTPPIILLSVAEVAARASVSTRTVKRWITSGLLPAVRLPSPKGKGHLRVRLNDLEALLARGTLR